MMNRGPNDFSLYQLNFIPEFFDTEKKEAQGKQGVSDCAMLSQHLPENYVLIQ
jgi:hypothetical protein